MSACSRADRSLRIAAGAAAGSALVGGLAALTYALVTKGGREPAGPSFVYAMPVAGLLGAVAGAVTLGARPSCGG